MLNVCVVWIVCGLLFKLGNGMSTVYFLDVSCLAKNIGCHGSCIFVLFFVWC